MGRVRVNPRVQVYPQTHGSVMSDIQLGTFFLTFKKQRTLRLLLDASLSISIPHFTSTPSTFDIILQLMRYIHYLLTYLLTQHVDRHHLFNRLSALHQKFFLNGIRYINPRFTYLLTSLLTAKRSNPEALCYFVNFD